MFDRRTRLADIALRPSIHSACLSCFARVPKNFLGLNPQEYGWLLLGDIRGGLSHGDTG